jgi:hypothetical protein
MMEPPVDALLGATVGGLAGLAGPLVASSMYWRALRDNGKDATLRVWPIAGHFPEDPVRIADVYHYWIGFIAQDFGTATAVDRE